MDRPVHTRRPAAVLSTAIGIFLLVASHSGRAQTASERLLAASGDQSYAFLQRVQESYCKQRPSHDCNVSDATCRQRVEMLWQQMFKEKPHAQELARMCRRVSTAYEFPGTYELLKSLYDEVAEAARVNGVNTVKEKVSLGSLPIREINARVLAPDPTLGHFIIFNVRFFEFASEVAKVAAMAIPMRSSGDSLVIDGSKEAVEKRLQGAPAILTLFANRLMYFLQLEGLKPNPPEAFIQPIIAQYQRGIELFAMGHEYAHIEKRHAGPAALLDGIDIDAKALAVSGQTGDWAQELEADFVSSKLLDSVIREELVKPDRHVAVSMLRSTPQFYFVARQIVDNTRSMLFGDGVLALPTARERALLQVAMACAKKSDCRMSDALRAEGALPAGHPHPLIRREFVNAIVQHVPEPGSDDEAMQELAMLMVKNTEHLWSELEDMLRSPEGKKIIEAARSQRAKVQ